MKNIQKSELVTVTGGAARVNARNNNADVTAAVTALKSSMDELVRSQANSQNNNPMTTMLPMMMMMQQRNQG